MILGLLFAIIAGALVALQNIFNSKVNERAGSWATTTLVLGLGFLASLTFGLLFEGGQLFHLAKYEAVVLVQRIDRSRCGGLSRPRDQATGTNVCHRDCTDLSAPVCSIGGHVRLAWVGESPVYFQSAAGCAGYRGRNYRL